MREMKDSGIEWIGDIPAHWKIGKLKQVAKFITGSTPSKTDNNKYYSDNGMLWIKPDNLMEFNFIQETAEYLNDAGVKEVKVVPPYTPLVCCIGSIGKFGWCNKEVAFNQQINAVVFDFSKVLSKYGLYYLCSQEEQHWYFANGNVVKILNSTGQGQITITLPSLSEQQAIADYLDGECARIDGIVTTQRQIIEHLKEYKKSVITEAVTRGLNPDAPMKDSGIEWIGKIPEHWEVKKLKYICSQRNEKSTENNLKYIGLENIISFSNRYIDTNIDIEQSSTNNICKKNDILFGKLRPYLAKCVISDFDGLCSGEFLVLHQCDGSVPYYHYLMLSNWFLDIVNSSTYGTKMPRANWTFIGGLFIPVPSYQEQQEIADYLDRKCSEIDSIIEKRERMIELMTEYKKSLIYECVTGKKEIVDVVE